MIQGGVVGKAAHRQHDQYYSVYPLHPDPAGPYIPKILECTAEAGIITTPAYQFYGFLTVEQNLRVILGPTRTLRGDGRERDELLARLAAPADEREGCAQVLRSVPVISVHRMAQDSLRQVRNMGICTAAVASRAAIRGGLDAQDAFLASDLYIQKLELMTDPAAIERLIQEMMIGCAQRVKRIRGPEAGQDRFFRLCAQYVSQNIFTSIRAERMAKELGYTRAYLCARFKQEAGVSLTRYVQQEKVAEAKRLLRFTGQELGEIAALLGFSSESFCQG